ncbi:hypothetical protein ACNKXS_04860 [Christiangramia marina]|uniref:hypothetical protein n=1 Tax=Christiangramia marina TaxID=409436 RepID=UPI003AA7FDFF
MNSIKSGYTCALIVAMLLMLQACTPVSIENNKRILVQGKFVTPEGAAIQGIRVSTTTDIKGFLSRGQGTLSEALSDENGDVSMVSLDVDPGILCLDIKNTSNDRKLQSFIVCDSSFSRKETLLDLGEFVLKEIIGTSIIIRHNSHVYYTLRSEAPSVRIGTEDWNELSSYDDLDLASKYTTRESFLNSENQVDTLRVTTTNNSTVYLKLQSGLEEYTYEFEVNEIDASYEIDL